MSSYIFKYGGKGITFTEMQGIVFVNATEMALLFEQRPQDWLALISSEEVTRDTGIKFPIQVLGKHIITESSIAIEYAYWLNPLFGVWCQQCIRNIERGVYTGPVEQTKTKIMNELIPINNNDGQKVVSARDLAQFLEVKTDFTDWMKRMFGYGFEEGKDFVILLKNGENKISKSNPIDYALTLDTAKEISMLQRTAKGKEAREYFIACEKQLLNMAPQLPSKKELAMMVIEAEERAEKLEAEVAKLKPRSEFVDKVFSATDLISIGQVAKLLKLPYGRNTLFKRLREGGIFFKNSNEPKQELVSGGYFEMKEHIQERQGKQPRIILQTYATQKGLAYLAKYLGVITIPGQPVAIQ